MDEYPEDLEKIVSDDEELLPSNFYKLSKIPQHIGNIEEFFKIFNTYRFFDKEYSPLLINYFANNFTDCFLLFENYKDDHSLLDFFKKIIEYNYYTPELILAQYVLFQKYNFLKDYMDEYCFEYIIENKEEILEYHRHYKRNLNNDEILFYLKDFTNEIGYTCPLEISIGKKHMRRGKYRYVIEINGFKSGEEFPFETYASQDDEFINYEDFIILNLIDEAIENVTLKLQKYENLEYSKKFNLIKFALDEFNLGLPIVYKGYKCDGIRYITIYNFEYFKNTCINMMLDAIDYHKEVRKRFL